MNKYYVKNCPAYDEYLCECRCETTPSIACWNNDSEHCPIKKLIENCGDCKKIYQVLDIEEVVG